MFSCAALLGTDLSSWGALLIGLGGVILLVAAIATARNPLDGLTWEGNLTTPSARATSGGQVVGAALVAVGSGALLASASNLSIVSVVLAVLAAFAGISVVMAVRLKAHLDSFAQEDESARRSLRWCAFHPFWRPGPKEGAAVNLQDGIDGGTV